VQNDPRCGKLSRYIYIYIYHTHALVLEAIGIQHAMLSFGGALESVGTSQSVVSSYFVPSEARFV